MAVVSVLVLVLAVAGVSAAFGAPFRKVFVRGLWALLLPPLMLLYGMLWERNAYKVNEVEIRSSDVPESFDGYRMVQISDMHLASFKNRHRSLAKAVDTINGLDPDLILFTGDLVTYLPDEIDGFGPLLSSLEARDGVYSVLGNHDYCIYNRWESDSLRSAAVRELVERETALGWKVLMNENVSIVRPALSGGQFPSLTGNALAQEAPGPADTLSLIGVENISSSSYFPSYGDLDKAMAGVSGSFRILLTHDPTHWHKALAAYPDIDLTLSGHTHAMQFSFFGWSPSSLMFDEYRGLYGKAGDAVIPFRNGRMPKCIKDSEAGTMPLLYVNIGLGETAIPARVGTRPEITVFTLRHMSASAASSSFPGI